MEARCLQVTTDGGYAILMELELTDGMLAHFCTALLKLNRFGDIQWFRMLSNDQNLSNFDIMMQGWFYAREFSITNDGGFIIPITGDGYGEEVGSFILKLSEEGEYEWHKQLTNENCEYISFMNSVRQTNIGEYFSVGQRSYYWPNYLDIMEVIKLSASGDTLWTKTYQDTMIYKEAYNLEINSNDYPVIASKAWDNEWLGVVLCINADGDIEWNHISDDSYQCYFYNTIISNSDNSQFIITGSCENEIQEYGILLERIDSSGVTLESNFIGSDFALETYLPSVISDFEEYILVAAKIHENVELCKYDMENNLIWSRPILGKLGDGAEILQRDEQGYFTIISVIGEDTLVLTKMDEDGNSTSVYGNSIIQDNINLCAYPNPFNPETTISFELQQNIINPIIEIFNIEGQQVDQLTIPKSTSSVVWKGTDYHNKRVSSGVYFYRIKAEDFESKCRKMILLQ